MNLRFSRDDPSNWSSHDDDWSFRTEWISQVREPAKIIELERYNSSVDTSVFMDDLGYSFPDVRVNEILSLVVDPDETVWVCVDVVYPNGDGRHMLHRYQSRAVLSSADGGILDEFHMVFEPRYPDLVFEGMLAFTDPDGIKTSSVKDGANIIFSVNVTNIGQAFSDRTRLSVVSEDREVIEILIKPLAPGEKIVLTGQFTAKDGMDGIELRLDPENEVIESDDQFMEGSYDDANIERAPLSVEVDSDRDYDPLVLLPMFILMMLLSLVVLVYFSHIRNKKIKGKK